MRLIMFLALVCGLAFAMGCSKVASPTATAALDNLRCPMMGHEVTADGGLTTWNGQAIGFCCESCLPKWDELPEEDKASKLAVASKADHE